MKTLIAFSILFVACFFSAVAAINNEVVKMSVIYVTNAHTAQTNFISTNIWFTRCTVLGKYSAANNNAGSVSIGDTNSQPYTISAGGEYLIEAAPGTKMNFKDWYLKVGTINDGLTLIFTQ